MQRKASFLGQQRNISGIMRETSHPKWIRLSPFWSTFYVRLTKDHQSITSSNRTRIPQRIRRKAFPTLDYRNRIVLVNHKQVSYYASKLSNRRKLVFTQINFLKILKIFENHPLANHCRLETLIRTLSNSYINHMKEKWENLKKLVHIESNGGFASRRRSSIGRALERQSEGSGSRRRHILFRSNFKFVVCLKLIIVCLS